MRWYFRFHTVGVDAHIDPFRRQNGNASRGGGRALLYRVSISHRRGGRPCPPTENARFYGNPMRIRNILTGQCGHRPLQISAKKQRILKGGQSRPPLQIAVDNFDSLSSPLQTAVKNRILHRSPLQTALALPKRTVRSTEPPERTVFIAALQGCSGSGEASAQNRSLPDAPLWTAPSRPCARAAPGGSHNSRSGRTGCTARSGARAHTWT